jgi:hypothetical protein
MRAAHPSSPFRVAAGALALAAAACRGDYESAGAAVGSASSIDSAFTVAGRRVPAALLNEYVARRLGFTSRGGEMRCAYAPLGAEGDRVFVSTACLEFVRDGDSLAVSSGRGGPVALRIAARGDSVWVVSHEVPADGGGHAASIRRIFPPDVVRRIFAPTPVHNARASQLGYYLRGEAAARLGLRPPAPAPDTSRTR